MARYPGWGGIETVTYLMIPELQKLGYEIDILSHRQEYEAQDIPSSVHLFTMPEDTHYSEANAEFAKQVLQRGNYNLIIYQDCYERNERVIIEAAKTCNVPIITFEHNTPLYIKKLRYYKPISTIKGFAQRVCHYYLLHRDVNVVKKRKQYVFDNSAKYVMLSEKYIPEVIGMLNRNRDESKLCYINNPVAKPSLNPSMVDKRNELLFVGRLVTEKNVSKILSIWHTVHSSMPDYCLTIVGDGPLRKQLETLVDELALPRVNFEGFQNPTKYYRRAKFLLMTSKFEGWAMTLGEAMTHGCVPIAEHNFSSLPDIVDDKINGFILPGKCSLRKWSKTLVDVAKIDFTRVSKNARQKAASFSPDVIARKWNALLKNFN